MRAVPANRRVVLALWGVAIALHHQAHGWSRTIWAILCVAYGVEYVGTALFDLRDWWKARS